MSLDSIITKEASTKKRSKVLDKLEQFRDVVDITAFSTGGVAAVGAFMYYVVPSLGFEGDILIRGVSSLPLGALLGQKTMMAMAYADADDTPIEEPTTIIGKARKILNNKWVFGKTLTTPIERTIRGYKKSKKIIKENYNGYNPAIASKELTQDLEDLTKSKEGIVTVNGNAYSLETADYSIMIDPKDNGEVEISCTEKRDPRYLKKSEYHAMMSIFRGTPLQEVHDRNSFNIKVKDGRIIEGDFVRGLNEGNYQSKAVNVKGLDKDVLGFLSKRYQGFWEALPAQIRSKIFSSKQKSNSLTDQLIEAGIPEEVIEANTELTDYITRVERNEIVSANQNFHVADRKGQRWLLKIMDDEKKARMEAAANYYLGQHFNFIVPGKAPEPIEANGLYMTLQQEVPQTIEKGIDYWIASFALFHKDAERIMRDNRVIIPNKELRSVAYLEEMFDASKGHHELEFRKKEIRDAVDYLAETDYKVMGHGDAKKGNLFGSYLVDLEGCGRMHAGIDLAMVLMQSSVKKEDWDVHLRNYLEIKGTDGSFEKEFQDLREGTHYAALYMATKEVCGSSLRRMTPETKKNNEQLVNRLAA